MRLFCDCSPLYMGGIPWCLFSTNFFVTHQKTKGKQVSQVTAKKDLISIEWVHVNLEQRGIPDYNPHGNANREWQYPIDIK